MKDSNGNFKGYIYAELGNKAYVSTGDVPPEHDKEAYAAIVDYQYLVEKELADGLKSGKYSKVEVIISTPVECNPLARKWRNPEEVAAPGTPPNRTATLDALVENENCTVFCVYQSKNRLGESEAEAAALQYYQSYKERGLQDFPVEDRENKLTEAFSGATYIAETSEGEKLVVLIHSFQVQTVAQNDKARPWEIWAGPDTNEAVKTRLGMVFSFLKKQGLDMNKIINRRPDAAESAKHGSKLTK